VSLRARLLITAVVLVAVGLAVANVATYRYLSSSLLRHVDEELLSARLPAIRELSIKSNFGGPRGGADEQFPAGTYVEALDPSGKPVAEHLYQFGQASPPELVLPNGLPGSPAAPGGSKTFTVAARGSNAPRYRVNATALADRQGTSIGTLIVAIPLSDVSATLHRLLVVEGIVSAIVLLLVGGLAFWFVRLGLRPLEGMGETAGAIAAGDLTRRVEPSGGRTEIGKLGASLNAMLAQIETAFEERRASEERLRQFVADASHELRTPLTSIRGYSELFRRGADVRPEDLAKAMRRIEDEAGRMGVLVDDLLLLARLDQGRPLARADVDLGRVAEDAVEAASTIEPSRPIDLQVDGPATVVGDEGRLRQVAANLLDNARVHTPAGTAVHVQVRPDEEGVLLRVEDEGPGLAPSVASKVFERFYRGDAARSRETGGAGLGLSIVAAIVQAHGGRVRASSADGSGGAAFEVWLPAGGERDGALGSEPARPDLLRPA
jgi:two-component system OmpR family sensor kinase